MDYLAAKLVHVLAMILWIGPPLGAYYFLTVAYRERDPERRLWAEHLTERVLAAEHCAFAVLIVSGVYMVWASEWTLLATPWLRKKLALFALILVFEVFDIWVAHRMVRRLLRARTPLDAPEWSRARRLKRWVSIGGLPVGLLLIPGVIYFALAKT